MANNTSNQIVPAGQLIVFTQGEYSDYTTMGAFVTLAEIDFAEVKAQARAEQKRQEAVNEAMGDYLSPFSLDTDEVIASLIQAGKLMIVKSNEVWMGSYGELGIEVQGEL